MLGHFHAFQPPPSGQNTSFWERDGKKKINKGKMDDRRQKVEEGDTSKRRSFCRG